MSPVPETCKDKDEWDSSKKTYRKAYRNHVNPTLTGCPKACHSTRFIPKKREDITKDTGNFTYYYVYYQTTRVLVYEEYLLFDFGSIVSAVGGSLGLFLGFSCWQMVKEASGFLNMFSKKLTMRRQNLP